MSTPATLSSVPAQTPYIQYVATNGQTVFPYPFEITQDSDLVVVANGVTLATDSGYTVSGVGASTGGNITFTSGRAANDIITLFRDIAISRVSQIAQNSGFSSTVFNAEFNNVYLLLQQLQQNIDQCLQIPNTNNPAPTTSLTPANFANKYLAFDANGNPEPADLTSSGSLTGSILAGILSTYTAQAVLPPNVRTAAEIAAGVTPTNYAYASPDLRRYGAKIDGATDDTTAINNAGKVATAAGGPGYIYHPGGNCVHASQILLGNNISVRGFDRTACIFTYTGPAASSAWRVTNNGTTSPVINTSGFGRVNFEGITITTSVVGSTGAALEVNACGYSFYTLRNGHLGGTFKHGLILDGAEVVNVQSMIIDNGNGIANSTNIWIVNGPDRTAGQNPGFSNRITIDSSNQINGAQYGIVDDGGSDHSLSHNNLNGNSVPIVMAAVESFTIDDNEMENAGVQTGGANILFQTTTLFGAASVGPCQGGRVHSNFFGADMTAGSASLKFSGASMHQGISVEHNWFRNNQGRTADIDVTKLSNSFCGQNYVSAPAGQHYTGVHNDADGNVLWPPQNGYGGGFAQNSYLWGDNRFRHQFVTGVQLNIVVVPYSASMTFDIRQGNIFQITANNGTAFTINNPTEDGTNGGAGTPFAVQIRNTSAGALGAITWGNNFKLPTSWAAPASGKARTIWFWRDETNNAYYPIDPTSDCPT